MHVHIIWPKVTPAIWGPEEDNSAMVRKHNPAIRSDTNFLSSHSYSPRRFCQYFAEAWYIGTDRYTPLKHHWKQIWVTVCVTVYTWLRPQQSRAKLSLPDPRSRSQREASWHPGQCTVQCCTVLRITALYCQFVLSALTHTDTSPFSLRAEDRKLWSGGGELPSCPGAIRGQPLSFLSGQSCRSSLRQLHSALRLTDGELK